MYQDAFGLIGTVSVIVFECKNPCPNRWRHCQDMREGIRGDVEKIKKSKNQRTRSFLVSLETARRRHSNAKIPTDIDWFVVELSEDW